MPRLKTSQLNVLLHAWLNRCAIAGTLLCGTLALAPVAAAETIRVVTDEFPPYSYTEDGKLSGFSTEVVRAALQEVGLQGEFQSMPWARAYETAQNADSVLIYSIIRNPQRENLFKWVGIIAPGNYYLFSLPERKLKFEQLEQARNFQIATVNEVVGEQYLVARGFVKGKNLQSSVKHELNYEKLKYGRVDLWISNELAAVHLVRKAGDDPEKMLARSFHISELSNDGYYMAFGAKTPDALVKRLGKGLEAIKSNGAYDALKKKWLQ